jgi:glutamate-ammonia-ligase adenylyltransferase
LATNLTAFRLYQESNAWTWEHLALTRARTVYADAGFAETVDAVVAEVLRQPRDPAKTIADVTAMRALMTKERPPRHPFDLKLVPGGLIDLEFIAQSAQLLARKQIDRPQAPTALVLSRLGEIGLVPQGERLAEIHALYSTVLQVMSAALADPFKDEGWTPAFRDLLAQLTNEPSFARLSEDIAEMEAEVSAAAASWYEKAKGL